MGASRGTVQSPSMGRAQSFFSNAGSVFSNLSTDEVETNTWSDYGKTPLVWQVNQAEEQMCEPECLQLLHEYRVHLEVLFVTYAAKRCVSDLPGGDPQDVFSRQVTPDEMIPAQFKVMLKELRFFPDFVQSFSLDRHFFLNQQRHQTSMINFSVFVETLCRISFCWLSTYGNIAQQAMSPKYKMLWMLAMIEARIPLELQQMANQVRRSSSGASDGSVEVDDLDVLDVDVPPRSSSTWWNESPKGFSSLWHRNDKNFVLSECANEDIILRPMMWEQPQDMKKTGTSRSLLSEDMERFLNDEGAPPF